MKKTGIYWHVHHDTLCEYCYDYEERAEFIKKHKPSYEIDQRLKLMQPVKGKLPEEFIKATEALTKARTKARIEAWTKYAPEIEALHKKECPDCNWDGTEIVFEGGKI